MTENERLVRENWEAINDARSKDGASVILFDALGNHLFSGFDCWSAAADFTRARIEEGRQIEEEIKLVHHQFSYHHNRSLLYTNCVVIAREAARWGRIYTRLQQALADASRGMKVQGDDDES